MKAESIQGALLKRFMISLMIGWALLYIGIYAYMMFIKRNLL